MVLVSLLWIAAAYAAGSLALAAVVAFVNGAPFKQKVRTRAADLSEAGRVVDFRSRDGLRLRAFFAPPERGRPVLVFQAGKRATRDHMLPWARVLAEAGYGIFTFDWRSQGESEGKLISYGAHARADVAGVVAALDGLPEAAGREVGVYACSLGASCFALAAPELPARVKGMVLDSPYGHLGRMADNRMRHLGPLKAGPRLALDTLALGLIGTTPGRIVPEEALVEFAPRPVLVFHGDADTVIPVEEGRSLYARYPGPKEYWETAGDDHVDARTTRSREWMGQVAGFFERHLVEAPSRARVLSLTPERIEEP